MYQTKLSKVLVSIASLAVYAIVFTGCTGASKETEYVETNTNTPLGSCATLETVDTSNLVWPAAPAEARVQYLSSLSNDSVCINGTYTTVNEKISYPKAVAADEANGIVYISDRFGLKAINSADESVSTIAGVADARGLAFANGSLYVADAGSKSVKIVTGGSVASEIGAGSLQRPHGIAVSGGKIYVADALANAVQIFSANGDNVGSLTGILTPQSVAVNAKGDIYVVHNGNPRVNKYTADGKLAGTFGPRCTSSGCLEKPKGIAIDSAGQVYITDMAFQNVQVFSETGDKASNFGGPGTQPGTFTMPNLIYIDGSDKIYVAETGIHRVQIFQALN